MEQKAKFILIGLIGVSLISFFLYLQALSSKQPLLREREELKNENTVLNSKISQLENNLRENANKINALNGELDRVSKEKQEVEKKYDLVNKEREDLLIKLQSRPTRAAVVTQEQVQAPTTDAYWAGILKAKTDLEMQLDNLRNELKSTKITNEELQREKSSLQLDINNLNRDNEETKRQLEYNQKLMDSISQELVREKNDKMQIQNNLKSIRNENKVLTRILKSLNSRKIALERKLQELEEKNSSMEDRFSEMETMLTDKTTQINELREQLDVISGSSTAATKRELSQEKREAVELPEIVVRPQAEGQQTYEAQEATDFRAGSVLAVNRENNFVIIDLGQNSGLRSGDTFQVYRGDNAIAAVEVIQLRPDIAACDIKSETTPIKVGDTIK